MGTKHETQQSLQFDPTSMSAFKGLTPAWANAAQSWIQNPYGNPQFQLEQQLGTRQAQNLGQTGINQLMQNQTASGFGGGAQSPFMQELLANQMRANTGLQSQLGFIQPMLNALQRQQFGMGLAQSYRPLQTGQHQTESTSGLGTWLPQVAGMGLSALTGGAGGGGFMGGLFGGGGPQYSSPWSGAPGMGSGFYSGANASPIGYAGTPPFVPSMESGGMPQMPFGAGG